MATIILASVTVSDAVRLAEWLIVDGIVLFIVLWTLRQIGLPAIIHWILNTFAYLGSATVAINAILTFCGKPLFKW